MTLLTASNHHARLITHTNLVQKLKHGAMPPFAYVSSCGYLVTNETSSLSYILSFQLKIEPTHRIYKCAHRVYLYNLRWTVLLFTAGLLAKEGTTSSLHGGYDAPHSTVLCPTLQELCVAVCDQYRCQYSTI
jgi:hypothetical protein